MATGNTDFIYKNELDKACFQHDMAYGKSKDLAKRTQSDKVKIYLIYLTIYLCAIYILVNMRGFFL